MSGSANPEVESSDVGTSPAPDPSPATTEGSPPPLTTETADPSPAPDAPADTSTAKGEKETLLQAVLKQFPPNKQDDPDAIAPTSATPSTEPQAKKEGEVDDGDFSKDPTPEELRRYNSRTRGRIQELIRQRDELKQPAEIATGLQDYLVHNDIAKEDFLLTLELAAMMRKGDFEGFLTGIGPYVQLALEATGQVLPQDLQQRVAQGHMTSAAAADFARQRYDAAIARQNYERSTQQVTQRQSQLELQSLQMASQTAVGQWEARARQSDPDFGAKQGALETTLSAVMQERGVPTSPQQAVEVAQEAYRRVNDWFTQWRPRPQPTKPVPTSIARGSNGVLPAPKSMLDAVKQGLERSRQA